MHNSFIYYLEIACIIVILFRAIQIGSRLTWDDWDGHKLQFVGFAVSYPLLLGGSLSVLFHREAGAPLLLSGMMIYFLSERRRFK